MTEPRSEVPPSISPSAVPKSLQPLVTFSKDELDEMWANVEKWTKDPAALAAWLKSHALLHLQVADKLALSPPGSRSGLAVASRARVEFTNMAMALLAADTGEDKK